MTDTGTSGSVAQARPPRDSTGQMVVSIIIVLGLVILGIGCLYAAVIDKTNAAVAFTVVGTVAGVLGNSLTPPSGISSVIAQAQKKPDGAQ